jgi:hypothetical protein
MLTWWRRLRACPAGAKDRLSNPADVALLMKVLPKKSVVYHHDEPSYEHLVSGGHCCWHSRVGPPPPTPLCPDCRSRLQDFIWGQNARERVYSRALHLMHQAHRARHGGHHHHHPAAGGGMASSQQQVAL